MITVKQLAENDLQDFKFLIALFNTVFDNVYTSLPEDTYLINLLRQENFLVYAAFKDDKLAGGLTGFVLPAYYGQSASVYLYDFAVGTPFQRTGIGKLLITELKSYCKTRNFKEVFVQTESDETTALLFYRSMGGKETDVRHFTYRLN